MMAFKVAYLKSLIIFKTAKALTRDQLSPKHSNTEESISIFNIDPFFKDVAFVKDNLTH
jgi:hypothetical protein